MPKNRTELLMERARLQVQVAHQRHTLAQRCQPLLGTEALGLRVLVLLARSAELAVSKPLWVAAACAALFALKPRRMLGLGLRGFALWRTWRRWRALIPAPLIAAFLQGVKT